MTRWVKTAGVLLVLLIPGGFLAFFGYALARAFLHRRHQLAQAKEGGADQARFGRVVAELRPQDVLRELRAAL